MLCLTYALSPAVGDVENFNVKLFRKAISFVIVLTLLLQGVLTQVCLKHHWNSVNILIAGVDEALPRVWT